MKTFEERAATAAWAAVAHQPLRTFAASQPGNATAKRTRLTTEAA
ncbi:hypothetical protein [Amycolatopsis tolypomycina]|uniref:Uncharacterized protein n=1 Tax=Amycolatopsis tolypomycina TaxID=208445 RepID=A0A1H4WSC4_9PSEU|nr:hypothetical protein [Amycolatopsis tolypomycina]SEC96247.1 hypothetical protein SAMN04489727_5774 [Amycolatopsis tolypomycina]